MKLTKTNIAILVLIIFHLVGIGGVLFGDPSSFLRLTPLNLLLTLILILITHPDRENLWLLPLTYALGFGVELLGVQTGFPFGVYSYEAVLGWKWFGTPLIIGVNWIILLYGSTAIARRLGLPMLATALLTGTLMVGLDFLIEPVAIRFDFWEWEAANPPLMNYIAWFVIATSISLLWEWKRWKLNTNMGMAVYAVELLFFGILNLLPQ